MSRGANLILGGIVVIVTITIMSIVGFIFPILIGPIAEQVINSSGAQEVGFVGGATLAVEIGAWIPGLLGFVVLLWFIIREILFDVRNTGGAPRRRRRP